MARTPALRPSRRDLEWPARATPAWRLRRPVDARACESTVRRREPGIARRAIERPSRLPPETRLPDGERRATKPNLGWENVDGSLGITPAVGPKFQRHRARRAI